MSMTRGQLLARCLPILEAAKSGKPVEDTFVEFKSEVPEEMKGARRIAGAANAARGEPVIWLVGIDEKGQRVVGASKDELSIWYPRVEHSFDGPAPRLSMVENIPFDGHVIVAMVFESDDGPYVVNVGSDSRDIPWREANRTRSAYRQEILQTLAAQSLLPVVDLTSAAFQPERDSSGKVSRIILRAGLYVKPQSDKTLVFPRHDCAVHIEVPDVLPQTQFDDVWLYPPTDKDFSVPDDVTVDRPTALHLIAFIGPIIPLNGQGAEVTVSLLPVNARCPVVIRQTMTLDVGGTDNRFRRTGHARVIQKPPSW